MKRTSSTITYLILSFVALAIFVGLYFYLYRLVTEEVSRTNIALLEVAKEQYRKDNQKTTADLLRNIEIGRAKISANFVEEDQVVGFIERVEAIGDITGNVVSISSINANDISATPVGTVGKVKAHVSTSGSWPSVMRTLALAEKLPYSVSINNLRLDVAGISDATGKSLSTSQWRINFDIEVLSKK
jgi:hypothetical protein